MASLHGLEKGCSGWPARVDDEERVEVRKADSRGTLRSHDDVTKSDYINTATTNACVAAIGTKTEAALDTGLF
jgi:hypothetical protein